MKTDIIGREREIEILEELYDSGKAELIAVYGRARRRAFTARNTLEKA